MVLKDCPSVKGSPSDESCVGEVVFGDYLCDTGAGSNAPSTIISGPNWRLGNEEIERYNGWNLYNVSCTLPDPSDGSDSLVSLRCEKMLISVIHFESNAFGDNVF